MVCTLNLIFSSLPGLRRTWRHVVWVCYCSIVILGKPVVLPPEIRVFPDIHSARNYPEDTTGNPKDKPVFLSASNWVRVWPIELRHG